MPRIDIDLIEEEWDDDFRPPSDSRYSQAAQDRIRRDGTGRVVAVDRGRVTVLFEDELLEAAYAGSMRREKVTVGDRVRVRPPKHENDSARVTERLDRETVLLRTADDTTEDERVVVANAEQVAVVISADYLDVGTRFLDRVLVAAGAGGLDALVCINKLDLVEDTREVDDVEQRYAAAGYEVVRTSAATGEGVDELKWKLEGCWTAMTGHSGVGKSSLFNLLVPDADHLVGEVGRRGGRHTTVSARALPVPGHEDTWLVDTPGVRSFGVGSLAPGELAQHFPELRDLDCALDDCVHDGEP
ncbi:MAG: ribosome small subunit-dependent GTPase A, partial [Actinobacteria bacterium]|nr:ribosome small subunit-dependent GTPase A [Actinomycetota bacterium]